MSNKLYCSYGDYSAILDRDTGTLDICEAGGKCMTGVHVAKLYYKDMVIDPADFTLSSSGSSVGRIVANWTRQSEVVSFFKLSVNVNDTGVEVILTADPECTVDLCGTVSWGAESDKHTFPMSSVENACHLRSAIGPAASYMDDMLFDRLTDSAVRVSGGKRYRMRYDWDKKCYGFTLTTGIKAGERRFRVAVARNVMADRYHFQYGPINKDGDYQKPPAGWMTWYSVGFDACEKNVLENTQWQAKHLKDYGADTIWIDWEWHHADYAGIREDGVDSLNPDPKKYPNGLDYVAKKIKECGFVPALWIGYTNDPAKNEFIRENPEVVLREEIGWCGTYYYDFTHPKYLNEFLPMAIGRVKDWGFEAIKYDTIWDGVEKNEKFHMDCYDPSVTTKDAFRAMIAKTRECMGENAYVLSCSATPGGVLWAADLFDAARVGGDTFEWDEYVEQGVLRVMRYYPLHNVCLYNDPDNVILSEQYNNDAQAASRAYFNTLLGLPMTFGDVLPELPEKRVDLLRRCLPTMDVHPMDIYDHESNKRHLITNLNVELPWESYNVVSVLNLQQKNCRYEVRLDGDLYLDPGVYHLYDFGKKRYLGCTDTKLEVELGSCESGIIAVRRRLDRPQIVSTNRHVTQGAAEMENLAWSEGDLTLALTAKLVAGDEYVVTLYVPDGYAPADELAVVDAEQGIYEYRFLPAETGSHTLTLNFKKS
ncbi:MAG: hypothetical protein E7450_07760 [Ruminococcaceae bacterium]|nr:hypothetical protein [Oscillospiraceae bacterium]